MLRRLAVALATFLLLSAATPGVGIASGSPGSAAAGLSSSTGANAPTPAECDARANDTPSKLVPCIQTDDLWDHMKAFQAIADDNPSPADGHPSRNSGEPGYKASADYVAKLRVPPKNICLHRKTR
jgi:hypothetical protein